MFQLLSQSSPGQYKRLQEYNRLLKYWIEQLNFTARIKGPTSLMNEGFNY